MIAFVVQMPDREKALEYDNQYDYESDHFMELGIPKTYVDMNF